MNIDTSLMIEKLLDTYCVNIEFLPHRYSDHMTDKYAVIEKEFLHSDEVRLRFFRFLLKVNCFYKFKVILSNDEEIDDISVDRLKELVGYQYIYVLFDDAMIVSDPNDIYMSLYNASVNMEKILNDIAVSEGLCIEP